MMLVVLPTAAPAAQVTAVVAQVLAHHEALVGTAARVQAAGVIVPRIRMEPLVVHQLVAVAAIAAVHLGPVVLWRTSKTAQVTAH
jgi:hypothetical protein